MKRDLIKEITETKALIYQPKKNAARYRASTLNKNGYGVDWGAEQVTGLISTATKKQQKQKKEKKLKQSHYSFCLFTV
ncbi:MAG: hypothetical protein LBF56_01545 [Holosporales bacterium]|jgi:uncharacterized protein YutD|nr:hypothetical protein [Holosporales bacterium]